MTGLAYEPSGDPGWDDIRASSWDLYGDDGKPLTDVAELLVLIGAGRLSLAGQRTALVTWTKSAAYLPAPSELKDKIAEFLRARP